MRLLPGSVGTLTVGAPSRQVRNRTILRPPFCEEDQATPRGLGQVFLLTAPAAVTPNSQGQLPDMGVKIHPGNSSSQLWGPPSPPSCLPS